MAAISTRAFSAKDEQRGRCEVSAVVQSQSTNAGFRDHVKPVFGVGRTINGPTRGLVTTKSRSVQSGGPAASRSAACRRGAREVLPPLVRAKRWRVGPGVTSAGRDARRRCAGAGRQTRACRRRARRRRGRIRAARQPGECVAHTDFSMHEVEVVPPQGERFAPAQSEGRERPANTVGAIAGCRQQRRDLGCLVRFDLVFLVASRHVGERHRVAKDMSAPRGRVRAARERSSHVRDAAFCEHSRIEAFDVFGGSARGA